MTTRKLHLGIAGMGRAFTLMLPTFTQDPRVELAAAADPLPAPRAQFARDFSPRVYERVEDLCDDPEVEIVYVASPHQFHCAHALLAAAKGKHLLIEKPMALTLAECHRMVAAAEQAGVRLIVGHSHSFDAPIRRTREIIASGAAGRLGMIQALNFTDFLYRARRPEELDTAQGGGVVFSQATHQIDIVRLLGGGRLRSVRAMTGAWDPARPTEGAYSALLTFADGAFASLTYSGYGHFDSDEFCNWIGEMGQRKDPKSHGAARRALKAARNADEEARMKAARNYGGPDYAPPTNTAALHQHFGFVLACCAQADLRPLSDGVAIYGDTETRFEALEPPKVPRAEVIDELYAAIVEGIPPLHDGRWAMATMEAVLAVLQSARENREIVLSHQTDTER